MTLGSIGTGRAGADAVAVVAGLVVTEKAGALVAGAAATGVFVDWVVGVFVAGVETAGEVDGAVCVRAWLGGSGVVAASMKRARFFIPG